MEFPAIIFLYHRHDYRHDMDVIQLRPNYRHCLLIFIYDIHCRAMQELAPD